MIDVGVNVKGEKDLERVRTVALLALSENARLTSELVRTKRENLVLKGATPEQLQQELALLDEKLAQDIARFEQRVEEEAAKAKPPSKKARKARERSGPRPEQKSLRVIEVTHDVDEGDQACRECGGALLYWEGQDDETEEVDVITREFVIKKHKRRKYRCKCGCVSGDRDPGNSDAHGRHGAAPPKAIPGASPGPRSLKASRRWQIRRPPTTRTSAGAWCNRAPSTGYPLRGCTPAEPRSVSPAGFALIASVVEAPTRRGRACPGRARCRRRCR